MTEAEFQLQVTDLASILGWEWAHFRPAQTQRGWRTPVSGPLGKGWPDLVLVRGRDQRVIFAELKRDGAKTSPDQDHVLDLLRCLPYPMVPNLIRVCVWHPSDFDQLAAILR